MITVDPRARISAQDILKHPWITKYIDNKCCDADEPHEHEDEAKAAIEALRKYKG